MINMQSSTNEKEENWIYSDARKILMKDLLEKKITDDMKPKGYQVPGYQYQ